MARRGLALLLVAAAAVLLPACAGDDDEPGSAGTTTTDAVVTDATGTSGATDTAPPEGEPGEEAGEAASAEEITSAAARTAAVETARVATDVTVEGGGFDQQSFGGEGVFDFSRRAGRVSIDLEAVPGAPFTSANVVFVDYTVYYGLPEGVLAGGKRWLEIDLQSLADSSALDFGSLFQGSQADPGQYLLWLEAIGPNVRRLGEEQVRGEPTTRYRATVDLQQVAARAPEGREAEWDAYVNAVTLRLGTQHVPVEIWVDGDGLVRRMRQAYTLGEGASGVTTTVTMELYDFGVEVEVSAPPAGQVASVADLIRP